MSSEEKNADRKAAAMEDVTESTDTSQAELSAEELDQASGGVGFTNPVTLKGFNPQPEPPTKVPLVGKTTIRR